MSFLRKAVQLARAPGRQVERLVQHLDHFESKPYELRAEDRLLYLFQSKSDLADWEVQTDSELGGKSMAALETTNSGKARFYGRLNTDSPDWLTHSGYACMFTSERRQRALFETMQSEKIVGDARFHGFEVRLRGDGRRYKFNIREEHFRRTEKEVMFQFVMNTRGGPEYEVFRMPFAKFIRTARGGYLQSQQLLQVDWIKSVGILLADDVTGPFQLDIDYIKLITIPFRDDFDVMDRRRPLHSNLMTYEDL